MEVIMFPTAAYGNGSPLFPLQSVYVGSNGLSVRHPGSSFIKQGGRPWMPLSGARNPVSSSPPRKKGWRQAQRSGSGRDQGASGQQVSDDSRVGSASAAGSATASFLSLLCPLLKFFGGGDPSQKRNEFLEVSTSSLSTLARFPWGSKSLNNISGFDSVDSPHLQIYEFEACPFCRRVREAMTELDLTVEVYPCPKGSLRHRELVHKIGGKVQFPFLVDLNTGVSMYESSDIVNYLFQQYGQGMKPSFGLLESTVITGWVPTLLRAGRGMTLWENAGVVSSKKLELFSYENNANSRIVREALCELELPYILYNVGKGSAKSKLLLQTSGSEEVPYLVDPNTGVRMGDHKQILAYLFSTYSTTNS